MHASNFSLQDYFNRIGYSGNAAPDVDTLTAVMRCQLFAVPFENLDVQAGKVVSLVPEEIFEKIVHRKRGGYCYEVNGVFSMALDALGIAYRFVAARPMFYPARRPKTHMAIIATIDGQEWLCDLGFGSYGIRAPMRLDVFNTEIAQDADTFMLTEIGREIVLKAKVEDEWVNQYGFDMSPQEWVDFVPANYLNSTHPDAIFVRQYLVVLHNPRGRRILSGDTLKTVEDGRTEKHTISPEQRAAVLAQHFGLML